MPGRPIQHAGAGAPPLLASTKRSVDQQANRRSGFNSGGTINSGRLTGSLGVTPFLKVTAAAAYYSRIW